MTLALANLAVVIIGTLAAMVAARALVELMVRAERRSRTEGTVYQKWGSW